MFKIVLICTLITYALGYPHATSYATVNNYAGHGYYQEPQLHVSSYGGLSSYPSVYGGEHYGYGEEHYPHHHPKYEYKYGVEDHHTGDIKDQQEHRDGDVVKGAYSLHQPDGRIRTVHYTSDKHNGFNADVTYSGHAIHPTYNHYHSY